MYRIATEDDIHELAAESADETALTMEVEIAVAVANIAAVDVAIGIEMADSTLVVDIRDPYTVPVVRTEAVSVHTISNAYQSSSYEYEHEHSLHPAAG